MRKLYPELRTLLQRCLQAEGPKTQFLIDKLQGVKQRGYFTKAQLLEMCKWKDPRELRRKDLQNNSEQNDNTIAKVGESRIFR